MLGTDGARPVEGPPPVAPPPAPVRRRWRHRRTLVAVLAALAILAPITWYWASSLPAGTWSVTDMGYPDDGGGPPVMHAGPMAGMTGRPVDTLRLPDGPADVDVTLVARAQTVRLAGGQTVTGYTLNGVTPVRRSARWRARRCGSGWSTPTSRVG